MKKNILIGLLLCTNITIFADTIPNSFSSGEVISATKMNENFNYLLSKLESTNSSITQVKNFVGVSTSTVDGSVGYFGMNNACEATFTGSRMCSSDDIVNSTNTTNVGSGKAWINPIAIGVGSSSTNTVYSKQGDYISNCANWTSTGGGISVSSRGTTLDLPRGGINYYSSCSESLPVACCK